MKEMIASTPRIAATGHPATIVKIQSCSAQLFSLRMIGGTMRYCFTGFARIHEITNLRTQFTPTASWRSATVGKTGLVEQPVSQHSCHMRERATAKQLIKDVTRQGMFRSST